MRIIVKRPFKGTINATIDFFENGDLSLSARFLCMYLANVKEKTKLNIDLIAQKLKLSKNTIYKDLKELAENGFLDKFRGKNARGEFVEEFVYMIDSQEYIDDDFDIGEIEEEEIQKDDLQIDEIEYEAKKTEVYNKQIQKEVIAENQNANQNKIQDLEKLKDFAYKDNQKQLFNEPKTRENIPSPNFYQSPSLGDFYQIPKFGTHKIRELGSDSKNNKILFEKKKKINKKEKKALYALKVLGKVIILNLDEKLLKTNHIKQVIKPEGVDEKALRAFNNFIQYRKNMNQGSISSNTKSRIARKIENLYKKGQDVEACVNRSIENNWRGIFEIKKYNYTPNTKEHERIFDLVIDKYQLFTLDAISEAKNLEIEGKRVVVKNKQLYLEAI